MLEKADHQVSNRRVRICLECAREAVEALGGENQPRGPEAESTQ